MANAWTLREHLRGSPWVTAIGVHCKKAHQLDDSSFGKIEQLVGLQGVRAIGEVGLDQSQRDQPLQRQVSTLKWVLNLCKGRPEVPLILHVRGAPEDCHSAEAHLKVLTTVREQVAPQQRIHLHCFDGGCRRQGGGRMRSQMSILGIRGRSVGSTRNKGKRCRPSLWKESYLRVMPLFQAVMGAQ
ncbi:tatD [Mytilus coruscus]|uniref:TatD n=1 Tax=Mytilus coruscus TaxID=42192 RepID=A0A6J8DVJ1_MYTCO|nr:tatD [Mytilus coruscus]